MAAACSKAPDDNLNVLFSELYIETTTRNPKKVGLSGYRSDLGILGFRVQPQKGGPTTGRALHPTRECIRPRQRVLGDYGVGGFAVQSGCLGRQDSGPSAVDYKGFKDFCLDVECWVRGVSAPVLVVVPVVAGCFGVGDKVLVVVQAWLPICLQELGRFCPKPFKPLNP